jgi:hypothetical protein
MCDVWMPLSRLPSLPSAISPCTPTQVGKWHAELLSRLDSDPATFPVIVIGNKVRLFLLACYACSFIYFMGCF